MHIVNSTIVMAVLFDAQIVRWVVWGGMVVLTIALLLLVRTRWGHSQPLSKCVVLSLVAHLLVGIYATTVNIVTNTVGSPDGKGIQVALIENTDGDARTTEDGSPELWNAVTGQAPGEGFAAGAGNDLAHSAGPTALAATPEPERQPTVDSSVPLVAIKPPERVLSDDVGPPAFARSADPIARPTIKHAEPIEIPQPNVEADPVPPPDPDPPAGPSGGDKPVDSKPGAPPTASSDAKPAPGTNSQADTPSGPGGGDSGKLNGSAGPPATAKTLPQPFRERVGNHVQAAKGRGATQDSEASVTAALRWLAANQSPGGRWEAHRLSGGAGRAADNEDRQAAGMQADTGITGLALLAFLAAGHTHLQGPHQATVRRGLDFLISAQDSDGCLGATNNRFERMYCHAMATCALSEAFAMTADERMAPPVRRAINYTVAAQDRNTGGWRYFPGDPGDTSQLGWQVMSLKSAELAGIAIRPETRDGIQRYLRSVAAGTNGGLARYRPDRGAASRSMTGEALVCREFMSLAQSPEAIDEASAYLLQELPGAGQTNVYYWYYATLGMYQLQGEPWRRWNEALQTNLLATQRHDGDLAGSWDPDPVWGGCGGRAYGTALSALCLEVYYRFLPLYTQAAGRDRRAK